ncbi:flagellar protein FliT [Halomonas saccharevitans]|uniref:Flagellar protein FliT n=1 Tax=Halomonas saccharevitans TaxID=416872 RepID=A0A1I6Z0P6_9GAMM|nr:flagellar protein FliT [Halomonas saccharevitans]SFT56253.1 flagellar protein FliT [Halomonas saccharevitans]
MAHGGEPSSQQALVDQYEALRSRTRHMLASAREADWPRLIDQQESYLVQVEQLATLEAECPLDATHRARKATLLEEILENDLEIRGRLVERRDELGELIGTAQRQRKLQHAYDVGGQSPATPSRAQ